MVEGKEDRQTERATAEGANTHATQLIQQEAPRRTFFSRQALISHLIASCCLRFGPTAYGTWYTMPPRLVGAVLRIGIRLSRASRKMVAGLGRQAWQQQGDGALVKGAVFA